ncbi:MAG: hypothetical protein A2X45_19815 [Lentisphaerae bacterium GWF2_50_93]|nr:MAG: hypothetical protein A2X45_19815 [Lentisphaerae bacterium GWF2_50_93]
MEKSKIRICMISEAISSHTQRITESLASSGGVELHLVSSYHAEIKGVVMHQMPIYDGNPLKQMINIRRIRKLFKEIGPDIYHLFGLFSVSSIGSMRLVNGLSPLIVSVWGSDIDSGAEASFKSTLIRKYILSKASLVISVSEYLAGETRKYISPKIRIEVISWPIHEFHPPEKARPGNGKICIGFAKKLYALSGPDILLKAFAAAKSISKQDILLRIAGDGAMESELKKMADQLGVADSVEWLGRIEGKKHMRAFYHSVDILAMPSRRESFGMSAAEASATGLPIIASRVGGLPEIVEDGVNGFLVESENVQGFAKAISTLAGDPELRIKMGQKGVEMAGRKFSTEATVGKLISAYRQILETRRTT